MSIEQRKESKAWLILTNGEVFEGYSFGAGESIKGEVVFTTAMTGFQETLTDPNYRGQIVVSTFPLAGCPGINSEDSLSEDYSPAGYVVSEQCEIPSNFRCEETIGSFMKKRDIVGIYGIDTRRLARILREHGTMNGIISNAPDIDMNAVKTSRPVLEFPVNSPIEYKVNNAKKSVALLDFGYNRKIIQFLNSQSYNVTVLPWNEDVTQYDSVVLSNGAGNPNDFHEQVQRIKNINKPIIGVGLGHQLLALAHGAKVIALKNAHRGSNIPVKNLQTGQVFITKQNHGYAVVTDSVMSEIGEISHINVNDNTCEGIKYKDGSMGFQYIPDTI